jgi:hypothetical protein
MHIGEARGNPPVVNGSPIDLTNVTGASVRPQAFADVGTAGCGCASFIDGSGNAIANSVPFGTNLVGFQDTASAKTHHLFYLGWGGSTPSVNPNLYEMYASDAYDAWTNHAIAVIAPTSRNTPTGLSALWDGSVEHVYWNAAPGVLNETYYSGNWYTHTLLSSPTYTPFFNTTAVSPVNGMEYVWGQAWSAQYARDANAAAQLTYTASAGWKSDIAAAPNLDVGSGTASFTWKDNTAGLQGSGTDGGLFYIGTNNAVYEYLPGFGSTILSYGAASNRQYAPTGNQITGFYDGGSGSAGNLHLFYVDNAGFVVELYEPASNIGPGSSGFNNWTWHRIGGGGNAAH